jgi:hypothetical protein
MANRGHNFDTISIALAGNFTAGVEYPTTEQIESLEILGGALVLKDTQTLFDMNIKFLLGAELDITLDRVLPHRLLQSGTDCYGSGLIDSWGRQIISRAFAKKISLLQEILLQIQDKLKKIKFGKIKGRVPCESTHVIG